MHTPGHADIPSLPSLIRGFLLLPWQVITVTAAFIVFPVRARTRLRKSTASILERTGNLAFALLGEFCEVIRVL